MIERPILFSAPMVRAILDGRKTVTRRLIKPQPTWGSHGENGDSLLFCASWKGRLLGVDGARDWFMTQCPYGQPGDRLWVKETHRPSIAHSHGMDACDCADVNVEYQADGEVRFFRDGDIGADWFMPLAAQRGGFVPSIHMPRWASRITLEVTGVRVERLQAISEDEAIAEGLHRIEIGSGYPDTYSATAATWAQVMEQEVDAYDDPRQAYRDLWEQINGAGSWDANPWVWVVEFRRIQQEARAA